MSALEDIWTPFYAQAIYAFYRSMPLLSPPGAIIKYIYLTSELSYQLLPN